MLGACFLCKSCQTWHDHRPYTRFKWIKRYTSILVAFNLREAPSGGQLHSDLLMGGFSFLRFPDSFGFRACHGFLCLASIAGHAEHHGETQGLCQIDLEQTSTCS